MHFHSNFCFYPFLYLSISFYVTSSSCLFLYFFSFPSLSLFLFPPLSLFGSLSLTWLSLALSFISFFSVAISLPDLFIYISLPVTYPLFLFPTAASDLVDQSLHVDHCSLPLYLYCSLCFSPPPPPSSTSFPLSLTLDLILTTLFLPHRFRPCGSSGPS